MWTKLKAYNRRHNKLLSYKIKQNDWWKSKLRLSTFNAGCFNTHPLRQSTHVDGTLKTLIKLERVLYSWLLVFRCQCLSLLYRKVAFRTLETFQGDHPVASGHLLRESSFLLNVYANGHHKRCLALRLSECFPKQYTRKFLAERKTCYVLIKTWRNCIFSKHFLSGSR